MSDSPTTSNTTGGGKSGIGVGSASIVLIFAVLCLTVFTLITYIVAGNHKALVDAEAELVTGYYEADSQAARILDLLLDTGTAHAATAAAGTYEGTEVKTVFNDDLGAETLYYHCPVNDRKALYVNVLIEAGAYEILSWQMVDLNDWEADGAINIWDGS